MQLGVAVAPAEGGLGQHEVARAAHPLRLEVVDGGGTVDGVVARPPAVAALRERPRGLGANVDEVFVAAGRDEHDLARPADHLDPAPDDVTGPRVLGAAEAGPVLGRVRRRTTTPDHDLVDHGSELRLDELDAVTVLHVGGARVRGEPVPQVVLGEEPGDPGGEVGGVGGDERVLALHEVETLGPHRRGDDRRAGHHRLDHLPLDAGAVEQRARRRCATARCRAAPRAPSRRAGPPARPGRCRGSPGRASCRAR